MRVAGGKQLIDPLAGLFGPDAERVLVHELKNRLIACILTDLSILTPETQNPKNFFRCHCPQRHL